MCSSWKKEVRNMQEKKLAPVFVVVLFVSLIAPWQVPAQDIKSGVVNSRDKILGAPTNQQKQSQKQTEDPLAEKGNPGPLPCDSKTNPKCEPATKTKPGE
jgi:hypothetical protein